VPAIAARRKLPAAASGLLAALLLTTSCTIPPVETVLVVIPRDDDDRGPPPGQLASALVIADVVARQLVAVADRCRGLSRVEYRIDCLGAGYARAAEGIPTDETFAEARAAVADAARSLKRVAAANRAAAQPLIEGPASSGPLTPVAADRLAAAEAEALAILQETTTVLLRSSATVPEAAEPYRKIAAALDSGKVLLRS
jgi:hypothetical protein